MKLALLVVLLAGCVREAQSSSQGQQDGIVRSIFEVISTTNRYFVELGFDAASYEDPGATGSNTHALWLDGWRGLLIDGDHENETINLHRAFVTSSNVVALLRQLGTPLEPDYISIDVDSTDLYILERVLTTLRPRVVTIEYNSNFGDGDSSALAFPDTDWMPLGASKGAFAATCFYGSSASAIYAVATAAGYVVVGVVYGLDLVLVRASLWPHPGIPLANLTKRLDTWPAMSVEDAAALIDHSVYAAGGSLCAARRAAAIALRRLARAPNLEPCTCFLGDADCVQFTKGCSCFRDLADLPVPDCVDVTSPHAADVKAVSVEDQRWRARFDLPAAYLDRLDASWFRTSVIDVGPGGATEKYGY